MIAVDTNILVYAHRADSEWHLPARDAIRSLAEGRPTWALPWPCLHEFLAIVTHPRIFEPPSTMEEALRQVEAWIGSPSVVVIGEGPEHWKTLATVVRAGSIRGPKVHDARIASICLDSGVTEFLAHDRDFSRFPTLRVRNPLLSRD